jgi:uncharacterized protein CbrC (UPF0167 family)
MEFPDFPYHPDPFASGVVEGDRASCDSCGEERTLFYTGPFYAVEEPRLCLWCVADGTAARAYDGVFVDPEALARTGVSAAVIAEVTQRTPSYSAWQQEQWRVHCGDACAYLGTPSKEEIRAAADETKADWADHYGMEARHWERTVEGFEAGQAGFYKFGCRHCGQILLAFDWN